MPTDLTVRLESRPGTRADLSEALSVFGTNEVVFLGDDVEKARAAAG